MDEHSARIREFTEAFREDRQVLASVERFQEQIRREQTQVSELQRLSEERQKRQLEEWQEENEKRWRKELLRWDHQWGEQTKRNQQAGVRFLELEASAGAATGSRSRRRGSSWNRRSPTRPRNRAGGWAK